MSKLASITIYRNNKKVQEITELYDLDRNMHELEEMLLKLTYLYNIDDCFELVSRSQGKIQDKAYVNWGKSKDEK